ncbi:MAG: sigma-70 family RNA polymerase sigma factor [Planctomycetes bacterium]|nr:sigma-70 family RNA polymerase sigma factor [Planctomycetota bacterium]
MLPPAAPLCESLLELLTPELRERLAGAPREPRVIETVLMEHYRQTGSQAAFRELYARAAPGVAIWVRNLQGRRSWAIDAVEVVQDTWCAVVRYRHTFRCDGGRTFGAWARTIAANALRRAGRRTPRERHVDPAELPEPVDPALGPVRWASDREEARALRQALLLLVLQLGEAEASLAPRDREALRLVEIEGHRQDHAARCMGVGLSNMKMILFRARRRLVARLAERLDASRVEAVALAS